MFLQKRLLLKIGLLTALITITINCFCQPIKIVKDASAKTIVFGNKQLQLTLDYNKKAAISLIVLNGQVLTGAAAAMYSSITTKTADYSTLVLKQDPAVNVTATTITVVGIVYGD